MLERALLLSGVFFLLAPIAIAAAAFNLSATAQSDHAEVVKSPDITKTELANLNVRARGVRIYASRPELIPTIGVTIEKADARTEIIKKYLHDYDSPLESYSAKIVSEADKEGIDYRFLPAIAQQESNLCKKIPPNSYNCWGWGITGSSTLFFTSYEEGIETVTHGLASSYIGKGLKTPEEIMAKYTPSSNGSWAHGVRQFMEEMK